MKLFESAFTCCQHNAMGSINHCVKYLKFVWHENEFANKFEEAYYWEPSQTSIMNSFGFAGKIVKQSKAKMFDWV